MVDTFKQNAKQPRVGIQTVRAKSLPKPTETSSERAIGGSNGGCDGGGGEDDDSLIFLVSRIQTFVSICYYNI